MIVTSAAALELQQNKRTDETRGINERKLICNIKFPVWREVYNSPVP